METVHGVSIAISGNLRARSVIGVSRSNSLADVLYAVV